MRSFITVLTIVAFAVAGIHAQGNEIPTETGRAIEQGADWAEIEPIPEGSRVNVTLSNGRRAIFDEAKIQRAVATHIAAATGQTLSATPADATNRRSTWIGRHPIAVGTLVGAGVGAALGKRGINLIVGAAVGAGLGALGTAIFTSAGSRATYVRPQAGAAPGSTDAAAVRATVTELGINRTVIVATSDGRVLDGRIVRVGATDFDLAFSKSDTATISYDDAWSVRRKPMGAGMKAAIIGGVVGGIALGWLACYGAGGCGGVS